jgi:hypothetical protein
MVIEGGRPLIKSACVPGIRKSLEVQVMAKFMAQGAQERSEGGKFLTNGGLHPDADQSRVRVIVAEEFRGRVFPDAERSGSEDAESASAYPVKIRGSGKKLLRDTENLSWLSGFHRRFDRSGDSRQPVICGQRECIQPIAFEERA